MKKPKIKAGQQSELLFVLLFFFPRFPSHVSNRIQEETKPEQQVKNQSKQVHGSADIKQRRRKRMKKINKKERKKKR